MMYIRAGVQMPLSMLKSPYDLRYCIRCRKNTSKASQNKYQDKYLNRYCLRNMFRDMDSNYILQEIEI